MVEQREGIGFDRARQRIDPGDRERVHLVAEVGRGHPAPRQDGVGERLQHRVEQVDVGERGRRVEQALCVGRRGGHEGAQAEHARAAQEAAPRDVLDERPVPGARPCRPCHRR